MNINAKTHCKKEEPHYQPSTEPVFDRSIPLLDPTSSGFSPSAWFTALAELKRASPSACLPKTLSVCFQNLSAHGIRATDDYQSTVGTFPLLLMRKLFGAKSRNRTQVRILHSFDGVVNGGEMLLVLGRPGSGCTTLLRSIAGDTHGFTLGSECRVKYGGMSADILHSDLRGERIYTAENDIHFPELTVAETLDFAVRARASRTPLPGLSHETEAHHFREALLTLFNLRSAANTKIGNQFIRGISGGERKRVSIAESLAAWSPLQCWDNSTRGLDSGTALSFVQILRDFKASFNATILMTVYQASESIFERFDKVTLLYEGQQIFYGPCDEAEAFFTNLGFWRPANATTPDFLTSLTHPVEANSLIRPGYEGKVPKTVDDFRRAWLQSDQYRKLQQQIAGYEENHSLDGEQLALFRRAKAAESFSLRSSSPYLTSFWWQAQLCTRRNYQRVKNNIGAPLAAIIGNTLMGIIVGSIFYNLGTTTGSFYNRSVLLFFATMLNAFMSSFEVLAMWSQRPIVEKQCAQYTFYHPCVEAIASIIGDLPVKLITSVFFNLAIYFLTNLRRSADAFFTFWAFEFVTHLAMSKFFRMIGSVSRTMAQTMAPVAIFITNYIIYTGFVIPQREMHPWLGWIRHINPLHYAFESVMINEFDGQLFQCDDFVPQGSAYRNISSNQRSCTAVGAIAGNDYVEGADHIQLVYSFQASHLWRNMGIILAFMVLFLAIHLVAAELIHPQRSKGDVLLFRRGANNQPQMSDEERQSTSSHLGTSGNESFVPAGIRSGNSIVHWQGVNYDIPTKDGPKRLLTDVNGWVRPGTLTALKGVTGAGKTTLLDVLANRVSFGVVSGDITVNSNRRDRSFQRKTGYVQQMDLHEPTATVRETLLFNAALRQPSETTKQECAAYVEEVISVLEMESFADAVVGNNGESLNIEQRKRLTIAVEMVAKPELLLFLDEPTSGLDSQTAWSICMLLRKLVAHGQAIMCTIHQPSAVLLSLFDQLLLLESPGRTIYFGPLGSNCETMVSYFENRGARKLQLGENPADWVFEISKCDGTSTDESKWALEWHQSDEKKALIRELEGIKSNATEEHNETHPSSEYAASTPIQLKHVLARFARETWRNPTGLWSMIVLCFGTAFFIGFSFWDSPMTIQGLRNQIFSVFLILTIFTNIQQLFIPKFMERRALYEAVERRAKTYSWKVLILANILVELPWQFLISLTLFLIWYYPVGLFKRAQGSDENERGVLMFMCLWAYMWFCSTFSALLSAGMEHAQTAVEIAQLLYYLILIFCGILIKAADLPRFWIFMYRVSPLTYLSSAMMSAGLANSPLSCSELELVRLTPPQGVTCQDYLEPYRAETGATVLEISPDQCAVCPLGNTDTFLESIGVEYEQRWRNFAIFLVYIAANICGAFVFYWLMRIPKKKVKSN